MSTSPDPYLLASTLLTPDELPKLALITYDPSSNPSSSTPPAHTQRIFVIISHISSNVEQCCVLVLKPRRKDPTTAVLLDAIPILPDLKVEIEPQQGLTASAATPRNRPSTATTLGLSSMPPSRPGIHTLLESVVPDLFGKADSSNAAIQLTLSQGGRSASGLTSDVRGLKDFLSVLKDLLVVAQEQAFSIERTHQWMLAYTDDLPHQPHHQPPGERQLDTPVFSRFSNSSFLPSPASATQDQRPTSPTPSDIRITIGTYNVASLLPPSDIPTLIGLKSWIRASLDPDILILCFQEVDTSSGAYLYYSPAREDAWTRAINQALGRRADRYRKLASKQLVGLLILVFVRREVDEEVEEVSTASVGVGLGGFVANKGAVAVRLKWGKRTMCFVNAHLSAMEGVEAMQRRCWDWSEIYKRMRFRVELPKMPDFWETPGTATAASHDDDEKRFKTTREVREEISVDSHPEANGSSSPMRTETTTNGSSEDEQNPPTLIATASSPSPPTRVADELTEAAEVEITSNWRPPSTSPPHHHALPYTEHSIMEHDLILFAGDLNFRLDLSHSEAHRLIRTHDFSTLYRYDQLESLRSSGSLFDDFHEGTIDFAPTYKFDKGTDRYDTSEKQRVPAWTDRVLWAVTREWEDEQGATAEGEGEGEGGKEGVVLQEYTAVSEVKFSDHRPVRATFLVRIR